MKTVVSSTITNVFYTARSVKFRAAVVLNLLTMLIFAGIDVIFGQNESMFYILFFTLEKIPAEFTMVISAIPAATIFSDEWCGGRFVYSYTRQKKAGYAVTLILSVFLIAALVSLISTVLFIGVLSLSHPLDTDGMKPRAILQIARGYANGGLIQHGHFFVYYIVTVLRQACYMGIYSAMAATVSIWFANSYVAMVSPMALHVLLTNILTVLAVPGVIIPKNVYRQGVYLSKMFDPDLDLNENNFSVFSMLYPFIYTIIILAMLFVISFFGVKQKNEKNSDFR